MKVLFGVDGSPASFEAVRFGSQFLNEEQDEAAFYYSPPKAMQTVDPALEAGVVNRARQALVDAVFSEAKSQLPAALAAKVRPIMGVQQPQHGLLLAATNGGPT